MRTAVGIVFLTLVGVFNSIGHLELDSNTDMAYTVLNPEDLAKGFSDKLVVTYYNYMVDMAVILGVNRLIAEKEMKESVEFEIKLVKTDWMDEKTRKRALDKIDSMPEYIGYPGELFDNQIIDEIYNDFEITSNNFFRASLNMYNCLINYSFKTLREPQKNAIWYYSVATSPVNTIYSSYDNSIKLPAAALQDIFFNKDRPQCMNYAAIGWILGREITHSFDKEGSEYDKDGGSVEWWQPETKEKYAEKTKCIVQQYKNYTLNGRNTKIADLADNEGLKVAYLAYQDWVKQHGPETKLPEANYSSAQTFWITAAQSLCTKYTVEGLRELIEHSPGEFRIRGAFSNRPEFAKDFNCPVGSNMNPAKKCTVW